jgi:tetratricopeptide (TPR) repeat protein
VRSKKIPFAALLVTLLVGFAAGQSSATNPGTSIKRGNSLYVKGDYSAAIEEYKRVRPQSGEKYSQALYNIGVCYFEQWRTEEAIEMYKKAIAAREGRYAKAWYALAIALEELNQQAEANEAYHQAIALSSGRESGAAHFQLGLLLAAEKDYERAATHFTQAITAETTPGSHNNLGVMLALKGRLREAEKHFEVALRQSGGTFADAAHNLKLCRTLLEASAKGSLASMKAVGAMKKSARIIE